MKKEQLNQEVEETTLQIPNEKELVKVRKIEFFNPSFTDLSYSLDNIQFIKGKKLEVTPANKKTITKMIEQWLWSIIEVSQIEE